MAFCVDLSGERSIDFKRMFDTIVLIKRSFHEDPMAPADQQEDTRERLIETAGAVFAEQGFRAATVREICARAGANVAAINYHFGDKQGLYVETVQAAHCGTPELIDPHWEPGTSPARKLELYIQRLLQQYFDPRRPAWHSQLMLREMAEPTEACVKLVEAYIR